MSEAQSNVPNAGIVPENWLGLDQGCFRVIVALKACYLLVTLGEFSFEFLIFALTTWGRGWRSYASGITSR